MSTVSAQRPNLRHYTARDGLVQSQALAVFQDHVGYLWVGSYGGVARYDGHSFTVYTSADGLRSNTVRALGEAPDGRLIVGTVGGGLCFLRVAGTDADPGRAGDFGKARIECPDDPVLERATIHDLALDEAGTIWAATDHGAVRVDAGGARRFGPAEGLPAERCRAITVHNGEILAGTDDGLARWGGEGFSAVTIPELRGFAVEALLSVDDRLFVAGDRGVLAWSGDGVEAVPLTERLREARVQDLAAGASGVVWLATTAGLGRWSRDGLTVYGNAQGLSSEVLHGVEVDREGTIWLAADGALSKLVPGPFLTWSVAEGLPHPMIRALAEDADGRLWAGTREGVARKVGERFETVRGLDLPDPRVYTLAPTAGGGLWVGGKSGLVRLSPTVVDGEAGEIERLTTADGLPSDYVVSLLAEDDGLWIGTDHGVAYRGVDGRLEAIDHPRLRDAYVMVFEKGSDGRLWLGLQASGVLAVRAERGEDGLRIDEVESWGADRGLTDLTVWDLARDARGALWIGSNGDGLFRLGEDGRVRRFGPEDGLSDAFVWQVLVDSNDAIWLYTNHGLDRFDGDRFEHFDDSEGLPHPEGMATAALEDSQGRLWFGTPVGVTRYDPEQTVRNLEPPRVLVQEVRVGGEAVASGVELPAHPGPLTFRFAALSFREESAVRFRHRLSGPETEGTWSAPQAEHTLTVVGLGPGSYSLDVAAHNEAGVWSTASATFEFTVRSRPWQSFWVRGALALVVVGLLWAGTRVRTHSLVTDRRRLEALVADRTAELERRSASLEREIEEREEMERAQQRLEERLRQSEKMEAVGRLAGGVAHDFNNLLTTISGYGDLLREQLAVDDPRREEVDEILGAAERAARLTQQLLAFSRKQVIEPRILHLNEIVGDIGRMLGRLIGEDVDLVTELRARPDTVCCDRGQLEQVLVNLAVNARDSMPDGGRLQVSTHSELANTPRTVHQGQEVKPGAWVSLRVTDTGHGMEADVLERIFEPFFTTKEKGKGTGLGLSTVYGIVRQNDGTIDVTSRPGEGTTFEIRLPLVDEQPIDMQASGIFPMPKFDDVVTVLVVEDEESVRRLISGVLQRYGYEVLEAASGREAFQLSRRYPGEIQLLLADVVMPEHDGHVVAEKLTAERSEMRVLYVSGYPDDFLGKRGILPEGTNFLNKPFTPKKLMKAVRRVLEGE